MRTSQIASCAYNPEFLGGELTWTWDTDTVQPSAGLAGQADFWSVVDDSGAINGQLAPIVRADACR